MTLVAFAWAIAALKEINISLSGDFRSDLGFQGHVFGGHQS